MDVHDGHVVLNLLLSVIVVFTILSAAPVHASGRQSSSPDEVVRRMKFVYPDTRRNESVVDNYHGTQITDPYRWLENPSSAETKSFVAAQNAITSFYLAQSPYRAKIRNSVMYVQNSLHGEPRVFFDTNALSDDGSIAMVYHFFSPGGQYMAYTLTDGGSDWRTVRFKRSPSGEDLPDVLERVKFSVVSWTRDNVGVFYSGYPEQNLGADTGPAREVNHTLYYHHLGTNQSEDVVVMERPDRPTWFIMGFVSHCGNYLLVQFYLGSSAWTKVYYIDLRKQPAGVNGVQSHAKLIDNFDAAYMYITNEDSVFTFRTNVNASNYKLINIDLEHPEMEKWVTLVEESDAMLEWAQPAGSDKLILSYLRDVKNELYVKDLKSNQGLTKLPISMGALTGYSSQKTHNEVFYQVQSFLTPGITYRYDATQPSHMAQIYQETKVKGFDFNQYVTKQIFYKSKDGTKIPMFIIHRKDITLDGSHPALLYGYGGYSINTIPVFTIPYLGFVQHLRGVVATANIRGGGEYGDAWHVAGMKSNKQNSFDDFQAAAEYLIKEGYTSSSKYFSDRSDRAIACELRDVSDCSRLTIQGGSNGGLLVGASVNQRPELFGCAIAQAPVMDMLRFLQDDSMHIGEYGSSEVSDEFDYIIKYSPLHNIAPRSKGVQYPAVLVMTAENDDRVPVLQSLKYIAELQHVMGKRLNQLNPLMLRIDKGAVHGTGQSLAKTTADETAMFCFISQSLNLQWHDVNPDVLASKASNTRYVTLPAILLTLLIIMTLE